MSDTRNTLKQIDQLGMLKNIVKVYGEIASMRMNRVRKSVLASRNFLGELHEVFNEVKASQSADPAFKDETPEIVRQNNGKDVVMFISANMRLYGDLVQRTFTAFTQDVTQHSADVAVIGKIGQTLFEEEFGRKPEHYFDYPDHGGNPQALQEIMAFLNQYREVRIHHGQFKNVVVQEPRLFVLSDSLYSDESQEGEPNVYVFEPSLPAVAEFFQKEIFSTLMEQTISESELAKNASRMVAMDRAEQNIKKRAKKLHARYLTHKHQEKNRKQLNSMTPVVTRFR